MAAMCLVYVIGFCIIVRNLWINGRRRKQWHHIADYLDLEFVSIDILAGEWEGRPVTIDKFTVTTTIISNLPSGFSVLDAKTDLQGRIPTGDSAFDEEFAVFGHDKEATLELLSADVRDSITVYARRNGAIKLSAQTLIYDTADDYTDIKLAKILNDQSLLVESLMHEQTQRLLVEEETASAYQTQEGNAW